MHEFLAARHLVARQVELTPALLQRCWFHPAWANVLDFALGLEPDRASGGVLRPELIRACIDGLAVWYGNEIDDAGLEQLLDMAVNDPSRSVRLPLRASLETTGLSVPWVERAIGQVFADLHHDPDEPDLDDLDAIAARLRSVGPGTRLVVTMLRLEPRLLRGPVPEAMMGLAARALTVSWTRTCAATSPTSSVWIGSCRWRSSASRRIRTPTP